MSQERSKKGKRAGQGGVVPSLNCIAPNAAEIDAAEEQRQRKHLESSLRRKAAKLGYQLIPLPQTA
jgi:hypothetical protein